MQQKGYLLSVYNPATRKTEDIVVDEALYNEYRRGGWNIENNDRSFHSHEIPFTDLKGGLDSAYENFDEFRSDQDDPARVLIAKLTFQELRQAWDSLTEEERELLQTLLIEGKSVREVAAIQGVSHNAVHKKKQRLIKILQKFFRLEG